MLVRRDSYVIHRLVNLLPAAHGALILFRPAQRCRGHQLLRLNVVLDPAFKGAGGKEGGVILASRRYLCISMLGVVVSIRRGYLLTPASEGLNLLPVAILAVEITVLASMRIVVHVLHPGIAHVALLLLAGGIR